MEKFSLQIVAPNGLLYDEKVQMVKVRTTEGDIGIRAHHINFVAALGMGHCSIMVDENTQLDGACIGGLIVVKDGDVRIVATTFEWADKIDIPRAKAAQEMANELLASSKNEHEKKSAQSRLQRATVRLSIAEKANMT